MTMTLEEKLALREQKKRAMFLSQEEIKRREELALREKVREARLRYVRKVVRWVEIPLADLKTHGPYYVAPNGDMFLVRPIVFDHNTVVAAPGVELLEHKEWHYTVNEAGDVVFLDRQKVTWPDIEARQARKAALAS